MKFCAKIAFACTIAVWFVLPAWGLTQADQDLFKAAEKGDLAAGEKALKAGANVNAKNDDGQTSAHIACRNGKIKFLDMLITHAVDLTIKDEFGQQALPFLLAEGITAGNIDHVTKALELGLPVNVTMANGQTALHAILLLSAMSNIPNIDAIIRLLLSKGADLKVKDRFGDTPLHYAGMALNMQLFDLLKEKGADKTVINNDGLSPVDLLLCFAVWGKNFEVAKKALKLGADINKQDTKGESVLHKAIEDSGMNVIEFLLQNKADANVQNAQGNTPAHYAAILAKEDIIALLKKHGADLTIKNKEGKTVSDLLAEAKKTK